MKNSILLLTIFITSLCIAQNTFPVSGNVGIGITNPLYTLDVMGSGHFKVPDDKSGVGGLTIETYNGSNLKLGGNSSYSWIQSHMSLPLYINELGNNTILNLTYGNVGIGTTNPSSKLEIIGTIKSYEPLALGTTLNSFQLINERSGNVGDNKIINRLWTYRDGLLNNWYNSRLHDGISIDNSFITPNLDTKTWWERDPLDNIQSWGNNSETYLTINNGDVGIGTIIPDAKLAVNGTIHSKEVKVDLNVPAPDYVFAKDYELRTLQEVEKFVNQNSHLPEIPSAQEFEENGIQLAEMNMALLKKVEELTLYIIKIEKNQTELEKRILNIENK